MARASNFSKKMTTFNKQAQIGGLRLTRKPGERVIINSGEIIVEVVEIRGNRVKLCFNGHKDITIRRGEVQEAIDRISPPPLPEPPGEL